MKGKKVKVKTVKKVMVEKPAYKKGGVVKEDKAKHVGKMEGKMAAKRMDRKAMGGGVDKKAMAQEHPVVDGMSSGSPMSSATSGVKKKG